MIKLLTFQASFYRYFARRHKKKRMKTRLSKRWRFELPAPVSRGLDALYTLIHPNQVATCRMLPLANCKAAYVTYHIHQNSHLMMHECTNLQSAK